MSELNLYVVQEGVGGNAKTRTQIGIKEGDNKIVFHNDSAAVLNIVFNSGVIRDKNNNPLPDNSIALQPGAEKTVKFANGSPKVTTVKYTATIAGAQAEDPIIIID